MPSINLTNDEFIRTIFGDDAQYCHVTDFPHDPGNIPTEEHMVSWMGGYYKNYHLTPGTNQYFTISVFHPDEKGTARRRKALFRHTPCIVLDDVKEKLSVDEVAKLPRPTWILETSSGSEQWGYLLTSPCTERGRVENLLDGLVANGLAPNGTDPGMKGVTRYVRLPEGSNNKASKLVDGQPYKCQTTYWNPFQRVTLEQLAAPFLVDLDAERRESRTDGAAAVGDHPLVNIPEILHIKEARSEGRYDVTCPWVDEHTGGDDSGAGIFTNGDNTIGFKCHHGNCQEKSGFDLLNYIEEKRPGFKGELAHFQAAKILEKVSAPPPPIPVETPEAIKKDLGLNEISTVDAMMEKLRDMPYSSPEAVCLAPAILKAVDGIDPVARESVHQELRAYMQWNTKTLTAMLNRYRKDWYADSKSSDLYTDYVYVNELEKFYEANTGIFYSKQGFYNALCHVSRDVVTDALEGGLVQKVGTLDYAPGEPPLFQRGGRTFANSWRDRSPKGTPGCVDIWLDHIDSLGWSEHKKHILQWMAFTIRHPEQKINHMLLLGGGEGIGKDWLLAPLAKAMGDEGKPVTADMLTLPHNDFLFSTKYIHFNEVQLGSSKRMANKIKPLLCSPPETLTINPKGTKAFEVSNIANVSGGTNEPTPVRMDDGTRRVFFLWSELSMRGYDGNYTPEWTAFWKKAWTWMRSEGGAEACIWYLRNKVDLSDFDPGNAPDMTQAQEDVALETQDFLTSTLREAIALGEGVFARDILLASDIKHALLMGGYDLTKREREELTSRSVAYSLRRMRGVEVRRTRPTQHWVIRNHEKYRDIQTSDKVRKEYARQQAAQGASLSLAPPPPGENDE